MERFPPGGFAAPLGCGTENAAKTMLFEAKSDPRRTQNPEERENDPGTVLFHENAMNPKEKAHRPPRKKTCFFEVPTAFGLLSASARPPSSQQKTNPHSRNTHFGQKSFLREAGGSLKGGDSAFWETFFVKRYDSRGNCVQGQEGGMTLRETFRQRRAKNLFEYMLPLTRKML